MDKKDFKKGEVAYMKYIGDRRNGTLGSIKECTVKSIGSKYVTTFEGDFNSERKFEIENDFRESYIIGGSDYQLYPNKQIIEDEKEFEEIIDLIRCKIGTNYGYKKELTLEQLRKIREIIL